MGIIVTNINDLRDKIEDMQWQERSFTDQVNDAMKSSVNPSRK